MRSLGLVWGSILCAMMSVWRLQPLYGVVSLAICLNASNALDQLQFLVFGGRSRKFSYVMEISTLMDKSRKTTEATRGR